LSTASIAGAGGVPVHFLGAIATTGDQRKEAVMDWARILAYVTWTVDQELLAPERMSGHRKPHPERPAERPTDALGRQRATLGEIGHRLGRKFLAEVATVARPAASISRPSRANWAGW
jgi:hypothetical protein